jgi:molybdopterin-biosynthesis enzyme MoeA-like protein
VCAEIVLVGDELLEDGHGVQPPYIGELMGEMVSDMMARGLSLGRLTVVGDSEGELAPILLDAARRGVDLVVTVGGLGPTHDDRVRSEAAAAIGGGPPEPRPESMAWLMEAYEGRGIPVPGRGTGWERMGHCPPGAEPLRNPAGLACGLAFELGEGTRVRCLPGVTYEALPMWRERVLPELEEGLGPPPERGEATIVVRHVREGLVATVVEGFLASRPGLRAGVYLMDPADGAFRAIRVTLRGPPEEVSRSAPDLANSLAGIEGARIDGDWDGGGDDG